MLKHYLFLFIMLLGSAHASAGTDDARDDSLLLDHAQWFIYYKMDYVKNPDDTARTVEIDQMRLDIGEHGITRFFSWKMNLYFHALEEHFRETGSISFNDNPHGGYWSKWEIYTNYPEGKTTFLDRIELEGYKVTEDIETPQWELVPDSARTILGYACQQATATFKGRRWTAWYAEDIPLTSGPWKLQGLPGLVLAAYDSNREYVFEANGLEQATGYTDIRIDLRRPKEEVTQAQLRKAHGVSNVGAAVKSRGINLSASAIKAMERNAKRRKYNPIERE